MDDIPGFSVVRNIPHDIMHAILEGVIPYEMLEFIVKEKLITIDMVNQRLTLDIRKHPTGLQNWMTKFLKEVIKKLGNLLQKCGYWLYTFPY